MKLYEILATEYTKIFPSSHEKVAFINSYLENNRPLDILDIGCASGELVFQLSNPLRKVTGIDLDSYMIEEAKSNLIAHQSSAVHFLKADMLDYLSSSPSGIYDAILCMGNTTVYLDGEKDLKKYLVNINRVLKDDGVLIFQILNYSNPAIGAGFSFPSAETQNLIFDRKYKESNNHKKLDFVTTIKNKVSGETYSNVDAHHPFLSIRIKEIASETGFTGIKIYGGYNKKEADISDFFHIIVIEK